MIKTIEEFYQEAEKYSGPFDAFAEKHKLVGRAVADHICYKCDSKEVFEAMRALLENESEYTYQSIISKRRIAYIRLKKGIPTSLGMLNFLELSDQRFDKPQKTGFHHIEVYPVTFSYEEMLKELEVSEKVIQKERPHHTTHEVAIGGFVFRCTQGPTIEKIKQEEML